MQTGKNSRRRLWTNRSLLASALGIVFIMAGVTSPADAKTHEIKMTAVESECRDRRRRGQVCSLDLQRPDARARHPRDRRGYHQIHVDESRREQESSRHGLSMRRKSTS